MTKFARLDRLPPYVFATVNQIKMDARRSGEDIIDFAMGNPDLGTPQHIIDKLIEASQKAHNHRYSASMGITKLRMAIAKWYKSRFDVDIDPETEAIVTIGVKEGMSHLILVTIRPGDVVFTPNPTYPIHPYSSIIALNGPQDCVHEICDTYRQRRDALINGLSRVGGDIKSPKGTMFVWGKIPEKYLHMGSVEFSKLLIREAKVAISPGLGFGEYGDEYVRFALIENNMRINQAVRGIRKIM